MQLPLFVININEGSLQVCSIQHPAGEKLRGTRLGWRGREGQLLALGTRTQTQSHGSYLDREGVVD